MRRMQSCAKASLFGTALTFTVLSFAGCGGGSSTPAPATPANESPSAAEPTSAAPAEPETASTTSGSPAQAGSADSSDDKSAATPAGDSAAGDSGGSTETRTTAVIADTVKAHRKDARACYEKALKQLPDLKGDLVIHFTLKPNGDVKEADVNRERSTIVAPMVVSCVIDVIKAIHFPASSRGMESQVNYPFNFNP
jgi:pyruvate/2-oxoglutarate dehydrogenase complex dihydrolipoamide acyltransferase (E2) component